MLHPTKVSDFVGLNVAIDQLKKVINEYEMSKNMMVVALVGPTGSGKTSLSNLILRENGYRVTVIDNTMLNDMTMIMKTQMNGLDVQAMLMGDKTKLGLIIEDIDTFNTAGMNDLKSVILQNKRRIIIIVTCSSRYENSMLQLKKILYDTIYLRYPTIQQAFSFFSKKNENNMIDESRVLDYIKDNGTCMASIISQIELGLFVNKNNTMIDMNQYELINYVLKSKKTRKLLDSLLSYDINIISLILLENITILFPKLSLRDVKDIYGIFVNHDLLNHYFLKRRDEYINYLSIVYIFYNIVMFSDEYKVDISKKLTFTQVITKMSAKSITHRKISDMIFENKLPLDMNIIFKFVEKNPKYMQLFNKIEKKKC